MRELLRGGWSRLVLSEAPMSGVWHCVSCQDVSGDSASNAASDVVMHEVMEDLVSSRSPE